MVEKDKTKYLKILILINVFHVTKVKKNILNSEVISSPVIPKPSISILFA